jgi:hypothetical protein
VGAGSPRRRHYDGEIAESPDSSRSVARVTGPVEVPPAIVGRVHALCLALPEATVRVDEPLVESRSTAWSFDIRQRSFCLLVAAAGVSGTPIPLVRLRVDPDERQALLSLGHPFFAPRDGHDRLGVLLIGDTDWREVGELIVESYRMLAPEKLIALIDGDGSQG